MTTTPKPHIPGPCERVRCDGAELSGRPCDSSPDACAKFRRLSRTGISLITAERTRQIEQVGWTPEHDAKHTKGELAQAAACYCIVKPSPSEQVDLWPWDIAGFMRTGAPLPSISDLVKAGALIAAEIDRRIAAGEE